MIFENLPSTNTPLNADNLNATINLTGFIQMFAGNTAPTGWLICDGSAISRITYADLYAVIGTTYGAGDGSTTFNLPDLRGRVPVGLQISDTSFDTLGEKGGEKSHTLTVDEIPAHRHLISVPNSSGTYVQPNNLPNSSGINKTFGGNEMGTRETGGGQPHNILQPYIVINYIIKL